MTDWEEEELEEFIRENKDKFDVYQPESNHNQHFLNKLINKFKEVINIVPYLVKVGIATMIVFGLSFLLWRAYIIPPLSGISFKYWKVEHDYKHQIDRSILLSNSSVINQEEKAKFNSILQKSDSTYKILKKQLKEDPSEANVAKMLRFYQEKLLSLEGFNQNYLNRDSINK
ncbi:MAG: hypothetical protein WCE64_13960 [Bacteroidales bacterium]